MTTCITCGEEVETNELPYGALAHLLKSLGGNMESRPNGDGRLYLLELHGRTAVVPVPSHDANPLDRFYVPKPGEQKTFHDFEQKLVTDVFWKLVNAEFWQRALPSADDRLRTQTATP
jgi:hypothetical protein